MKLQFTNQPYQDAAVNAVTDLFAGEGSLARQYYRHASMLLDSVGNSLPTPLSTIQTNLHSVQQRNLLPLTDDAERLSFCVEMETGTGKTYVYIKTIYELHKRYGLSKFVIVVPSVAIREGVQKFLDISHSHFQTHYNRQPIHWFVYNSSRLGEISDFAHSTNIEIMIINIDAFRKSENIIHQNMDRMNGGRAIDLVRLVRPVVIIDEPQSVDNTPKAKEAISWLDPLFTLRYSATHREKINTVYRLTPVDAYQQGLVKQISVSSIMALEGFNQPYLRLVSVSNDNGYKAKVELDVKGKSGKIARSVKTLKLSDDLFMASGEREIYRGWQISNIDCLPGQEMIELSNTHTVALGQSIGDVSYMDIKRGQIRRSIEIHLEKELRLLQTGVKVLTLFFIDQVDRYRLYEGNTPQKGEYAEIFETEYNKLINLDKYAPIRQKLPLASDAAKAHDGYFSVDKKGKLKDTRGDTADDQNTYALIMRDKEKLLSFSEPLRFIFSHSTLKEGWDNPNVFQVCTLLEQSSALSARQKIGRGLRLCVNQDGQRLYDRQLNTLHVIASEHFAEFADNLQREIEQETGVKFGVLDIESFINIDVPIEAARQMGIDVPDVVEVASVTNEQPELSTNEPVYTEPTLPTFDAKPDITINEVTSGEPVITASVTTVKLGDVGAKRVLESLKETGVIDKKGRITKQGREQVETGKITLPEAYQPIANPIIAQIRAANRKIEVRDANREIVVRKKKQVFLTPEFTAIWERICQKTRYRVRMELEKFIDHAANKINKMPSIQNARIIETNADIDIVRVGVTSKETFNRTLVNSQDETPRPDLMLILRNELFLCRSTTLAIIKRSGRARDFLVNPERFIEEIVPLIRDSKAAMIVDGIRYLKLAGEEYSVQELFDKDELIAYLDSNAVPVEHSVYDHVVVDNSNIERRFAEALDADPDVKLFFKLPAKFKIDTPLGAYNPDWAVLIETPEAHRLYFVLETKGSTWEFDRRMSENIKTDCGKQHFEALGEVVYKDTDEWNKVKRNI